MASVNAKWTKNLIAKAWRRCSNTSPKQTSREGSSAGNNVFKRKKSKASRVTPVGCFSVYVGSEKQRNVVKTELANHPLFKVLLEEAASVYGYKNEGPIVLPCDVNLFYNVLAEIESTDSIDEDVNAASSSLIQFFFSPTRHRLNWRINKGCGGAYRRLNESQAQKF